MAKSSIVVVTGEIRIYRGPDEVGYLTPEDIPEDQQPVVVPFKTFGHMNDYNKTEDPLGYNEEDETLRARGDVRAGLLGLIARLFEGLGEYAAEPLDLLPPFRKSWRYPNQRQDVPQ